MTKPILHNVRILDFTRVLAGPYATRLLADYGAEVIKVQPPPKNEEEDAVGRAYDNFWNRNKLSITINMNTPEGIELAKHLVGICDAVIENFTPRVMENWGLDYSNLRKIKPEIILVSMSAMGQKSPQRDYAGYAPTVHALSGMTALTSFSGQPPVGPGFSYADHIAGLYASLKLLGALEERRRMGWGQHIDISETDVLKSLLAEESPPAAPHALYISENSRWCAISVFTEEEWAGLKSAMGNPAWAEEARFTDMTGRQQNKEELDKLICEWTQQHNAEEMVDLLRDNEVAAGIVKDVTDIVRDPQLWERGFFTGGGENTPPTETSPIKIKDSGASFKKPAPAPGHDNAYVYGKLLGITKKDITGLKEKGVI